MEVVHITRTYRGINLLCNYWYNFRHMNKHVSSFPITCIFTFSPYYNAKTAFFNLSTWESIFKKCLQDTNAVLVWIEGQKEEFSSQRCLVESFSYKWPPSFFSEACFINIHINVLNSCFYLEAYVTFKCSTYNYWNFDLFQNLSLSVMMMCFPTKICEL